METSFSIEHFQGEFSYGKTNESMTKAYESGILFCCSVVRSGVGVVLAMEMSWWNHTSHAISLKNMVLTK